MYTPILYDFKTLILFFQFCFISLVLIYARVHNDTRDWQAYRNWFLNSALVFSSAKINIVRTDATNVNVIHSCSLQGAFLFAFCNDQINCVAQSA